jgi:Fe-S-cluster containining protein
LQTEQINVGITVFGEHVEMSMSVPAEPVKLRRMLPLLRQISNGFVGAAEEQVALAGKSISCKAGCGACCRQLVPVSEAEAFELNELVESMPEHRREMIRQRFADGLIRLRSDGYFERLEAASQSSDEAYVCTVKEYFEYGIACPFLEYESCSIHEHRPVTCREYLVTSPPELCARAEGTGVQNVRQLFQLKEALIIASRQATTDELPYVPMISVLEWASGHDDDAQELTGRDWISGIVKLMQHYGKRARENA